MPTERATVGKIRQLKISVTEGSFQWVKSSKFCITVAQRRKKNLYNRMANYGTNELLSFLLEQLKTLFTSKPVKISNLWRL